MRTTLKREIGRAAFPNGNGRGVLPPALVTGVSRYRQPPPRGGPLRLLARVAVWLAASLAVVAAGLAGGVYLYAHAAVADLSPRTKAIRDAQRDLDVSLPNEPATALVIGYDRRAGEQSVYGARSDTIMLVRADPIEETLSVLSFPRDLLVEVRCPRRRFLDRINEAFSKCGPRGTLRTVGALTGLPIHYLVTVNFRGFKQVVARLGGVWVDVDRRYFNDRGGPGGYATIDLQPGYQKLNGSDALDFVRYRHTDNDFYRIARQQLFLHAFKQAVTSSFSPTQLPRIAKVVTDNVEVAKGGHPLSLETILRYGLLAYQLPDGHFVQSRLEQLGEDEAFNLYADAAEVSRAVEAFVHPDVQPVAGRARRAQAPAPRRTTVLVLNGNGVPGAAANASDLLAKKGYRAASPPPGVEANAPRMNYARSEVLFDPRQQSSEAAARALARLIGDASVGRLPRTLRTLANGAMVVVILGQSFGGELVEPRARERERERAELVRDASATLPLLRPLRGRVPFPLVVPTVLERTSRPDSQAPVRRYELAGHEAVRLVFRTGENEYWGVQMTDWTDAPILAEPNDEISVRGRRYALYYSGRKLRMVVLREGEASYWVVNTLLNSLSNREMLGIAKGLRPLPRQ